MSLFGALNVGKTSLATQQIGLQVTGSNIANANTPGYSRQVVGVTTDSPEQVGLGQYVGGAGIATSIERQVSDALQTSLRDSTSGQNQSRTLQDFLGRLESTFGALNTTNLDTKMADFFGSFKNLANNPQDSGLRAVVVQAGASLASNLQGLRTLVLGVRDDAEVQIGQYASQANDLASCIADLNSQITNSESSGGTANTLRDQRDQDLSKLSEIMDIRTINLSNGMVTVLAGNSALVQGVNSRGLKTTLTPDATGKLSQTNLVFADNGDSVSVAGGKLGGLISVRDTHIDGALDTLDSLAGALIDTVNTIHSQGQGRKGFSTLAGATAVNDPTLTLNAPQTNTGSPTVPVNGTFNFNLKDLTTGLITTRQIAVDFSGSPPTSLNSLAASLNGGVIQASVDASGHLTIKSTSANTTFNFSDDTSGALAAVGVNTFFTGTDASNIAVNQTVAQSPDLVATGLDNKTGSNDNANLLAQGYATVSKLLGSVSLSNYYSQYMSKLASTSAGAKDDATAQTQIHDTLAAQQQSISGVNMDEEAINLTKYQRAFEGSARFITVVDQMMQTVLGLIR